MSLEFDAVHDQIAELCRRYGNAELSVFGSVARGEDRPDSDVDLLYVSAPNSKNSLKAIDRISHWLSGIDEGGWDSDDMLRAAVLQQLTTIGEASRNVSNQLRERHPAVPWRRIADFVTSRCTNTSPSSGRWSGVERRIGCRIYDSRS